MSTGVNTIDNIQRIKFNDEFVFDFNRSPSLLKKTVNSNGMSTGSDSVRFDIVDPADEAQTRTRDGRIPVSQLGYSQVSAPVLEIFKKYQIDSFDVFKKNPNTRAAMAKRGVTSINQGIDNLIIQELESTTTEVSATAGILSTLAAVTDWIVRLWENDVPQDGNVWGVITPKAQMQMLRINEYKSADFIRMEDKPVASMGMPIEGYRSWLGIKWITHTGIAGRGTANANCYVYHMDAIGHMIDGEPMMNLYYTDDEDRYGCWARARHAAKVCLPRGIVRFRHNDTSTLTA